MTQHEFGHQIVVAKQEVMAIVICPSIGNLFLNSIKPLEYAIDYMKPDSKIT